MRRELLGHAACEVRLETAIDVNALKLSQLRVRKASQLALLALEIGMLGVRLRAYRDVLAGRHRHCAGHQTGDTSNEDITSARSCSRDANDETRSRDDSIIGAKHRCSHPADSLASVSLRWGSWYGHLQPRVKLTSEFQLRSDCARRPNFH